MAWTEAARQAAKEARRMHRQLYSKSSGHGMAQAQASLASKAARKGLAQRLRGMKRLGEDRNLMGVRSAAQSTAIRNALRRGTNFRPMRFSTFNPRMVAR